MTVQNLDQTDFSQLFRKNPLTGLEHPIASLDVVVIEEAFRASGKYSAFSVSDEQGHPYVLQIPAEHSLSTRMCAGDSVRIFTDLVLQEYNPVTKTLPFVEGYSIRRGEVNVAAYHKPLTYFKGETRQ